MLIKKQKGGASSSFRTLVYSRGPVNYPDNSWHNSKLLFNQFNKTTGQYIPNKMLPYYAAPLSTGYQDQQSPVCSTMSNYTAQYAPFNKNGGKKYLKK